MRRRDLITLVGGAAAWPLTVRAQQQSLPLIGFMGVGPVASPDILRGLAANGFVRGRDFRAEYRWAASEPTSMANQAADLVKRGASVIVANGLDETLAAKGATQSIPIVFLSGADPVEIGLARSLNQPGGNLTGVSVLTAGLIAKRLEVLRELAPTAKSFAYLGNPTETISESERKELEIAARTLDVQLIYLTAKNPGEIDAAFATLTRGQANALVVSGSTFFFGARDQLPPLASWHKVPAIYASREYAVSGGLVSFGTPYANGWYTMGVYVARILKGEKPSDLPVEQITRTELVVNLGAAKALGLAVPPTLLARADEVIE